MKVDMCLRCTERDAGPEVRSAPFIALYEQVICYRLSGYTATLVKGMSGGGCDAFVPKFCRESCFATMEAMTAFV